MCEGKRKMRLVLKKKRIGVKGTRTRAFIRIFTSIDNGFSQQVNQHAIVIICHLNSICIHIHKPTDCGSDLRERISNMKSNKLNRHFNKHFIL